MNVSANFAPALRLTGGRSGTISDVIRYHERNRRSPIRKPKDSRTARRRPRAKPAVPRRLYRAGPKWCAALYAPCRKVRASTACWIEKATFYTSARQKTSGAALPTMRTVARFRRACSAWWRQPRSSKSSPQRATSKHCCLRAT